MNKDKALEELFLAQKPHFEDSDAFMASLAKRLDTVEYIKQHQEATIRHYKLAMLVAFIAGIISGGLALTYILSTPIDAPIFNINTQFVLLQWLCEKSRFLVVMVISLLMTCGIAMLISNIQEIINMRTRLNDSEAQTVPEKTL